MKTPMKLRTTFDHTINLGAYLAGGFVVFIMLTIVADVTSRKLAGQSIPWVVQFSEYSLCYLTFLGAAWLLKREGHVKIDIVVSRLNPRNQALLNLVTSIVGAIVLLVVAGYGVITTWDLFQRGVYDPLIIRVPKGPLVAVIPLGGFLLFIQFLRKAYGHLREWRAL